MYITSGHYELFNKDEEEVVIKRTEIGTEKTPWLSKDNIYLALDSFLRSEYGKAIVLKYHGIPLIFCTGERNDERFRLVKAMTYPISLRVGRIEQIDDKKCVCMIDKMSSAYRMYIQHADLSKMNIQVNAITNGKNFNECSFMIFTLHQD